MADYISNYSGAQIDKAIGVGLSKGVANGIASLDAGGKVPSEQLPKVTVSGILKGDGAGGISAAVAGTDYAAMTNLRGRNLLDNPWFTVNQRGQSIYTGYAGYCVDRWYKYEDASITVGASGLIFAGGTNNNLIEQRIEEDLSGLKITMSAIVDGVLYSGQKVVDQYDYVNAVHIPEGSIRVMVRNGHTRFRVWFNSTNEHTVSAVKLELGEVSTLANDTAPNYAEELAKCQRYYREFSPMFSLGMNHGGMIAFRYATSPQMRALPTITMENGNNLTDCLDSGNSPATPSAVTLNWATSADSIGFYFSGVPTDKAYVCRRKIYASADL